MKHDLFSRLIALTGPGTALQEILYGFIMGLIFIYGALFGLLEFESTTAFVIAEVGMCVTWGVIDGIIFYYIWTLETRRTYEVITNNAGMDRESRVNEIMDSLSGTALDVISDEEKRAVCQNILDKEIQSVEELRSDNKAMIMNSLGCVFFGSIALVPLLAPLLFIDDFMEAIEMSCWIASIVLFFTGYSIAPYIRANRILTGVVLAGISLLISIIAVFTGG